MEGGRRVNIDEESHFFFLRVILCLEMVVYSSEMEKNQEAGLAFADLADGLTFISRPSFRLTDYYTSTWIYEGRSKVDPSPCSFK